MRLKHLLPIKYIVFLASIILLTGCYTVALETQFENPFEQLAYKYAIRLDATWNAKRAESLVNILESIAPKPDINVTTSTWKISNDEMQDDIFIESQNGIKTVTVSSNVFPLHETNDIAAPDRQLFSVVVQFITENGTNTAALKTILSERYGITVDIPNYDVLTQRTTKETKDHYRAFENRELMILISILEDFPQALHKFPQLKYFICRKEYDGKSAAIAWTTDEYIEIVQSVISRDFVIDTKRLIAHEKAHFLWAHLFPQQLKNDWKELGGWYQNKKSKTGWSTNKARETFITSSAYEKNPDEDMAESLGYYLVYPEQLLSRCPEKYDFIHNRIMLAYGTRYLSPNR